METFEKKIRGKFRRAAILAVLGVFISILEFAAQSKTAVSASVIAGGFLGFESVCVCNMLRYKKALRTRETLEELYIKEIDERNVSISLNTCRSCLNLTLGLLGAAGLISKFFNHTVFMTIGYILIGVLILYGVLTLYYSKKF
ncbi:hypothetical protein FACS1894188_11470 [Clostridia bacterium]|nr:hypothetical protein FACS1894188_11470 [Clostridia bacterium]